MRQSLRNSLPGFCIMDVEKIEKNMRNAASMLKALSNEKRLKILCILNDGEQSVGALEDLVGLSQSALSQHLARLRRDGLVNTRRDAQTIYYSRNEEKCAKIMDFLQAICEDDFSSEQS